MDLFKPLVQTDKRHPIFRMLNEPTLGPERAVLQDWATDFVDRDGKFVKEFQTTFESSFWELYLHAGLRSMGMQLDYAFHAPDVRCKGVRHAYASCSAFADAVLEVVATLLLSGADDHGAAQQLIGRDL